jgi:diguanylate cyclase (GGDEF)-like protein
LSDAAVRHVNGGTVDAEMGTFFTRSSAIIAAVCVAATIAIAAVCGWAVHGLSTSAQHAEAISSDEVATTTLTASFAVDVDRAYASAVALALGGTDTALATDLYDSQLPAVELRLAELLRVHSDDEPEEAADLRVLADQWRELRQAINAGHTGTRTGVPDAAAVQAAHRVLSDHLQELVNRELEDARVRKDDSDTAVAESRDRLLVTALVAVVVLFGIGLLGSRLVRREIDPARNAAEFADTLQLTEDEEDAHQLLQRRILQVLPGSQVTVLNRNNSADRLEPMTELPLDSDLARRLEEAEPRACLAIRSARTHTEDPRREQLMNCSLCQTCPGFSACTPLTVGGEVIGSVLVNREQRYDGQETRLVRDAVAQAAPVLANLRNLAIAELRASTDALTGLPNKRAFADNLKRMFAQAARTSSPMSLVMLDLDHFKNLNDRFGHPVGDQVLAAVGATLRSSLRESDFAGRNGGEEFAVVLPGTDVPGAVAAAETLRAAIADISVPGLHLDLSASFGVATYPEHALSTERLERLSDAALYVAKRSGRNRVEVATETLELSQPPAAPPHEQLGEGLDPDIDPGPEPAPARGRRTSRLAGTPRD